MYECDIAHFSCQVFARLLVCNPQAVSASISLANENMSSVELVSELRRLNFDADGANAKQKGAVGGRIGLAISVLS